MRRSAALNSSLNSRSQAADAGSVTLRNAQRSAQVIDFSGQSIVLLQVLQSWPVSSKCLQLSFLSQWLWQITEF